VATPSGTAQKAQEIFQEKKCNFELKYLNYSARI
jgi:hypothetical protein